MHSYFGKNSIIDYVPIAMPIATLDTINKLSGSIMHLHCRWISNCLWPATVLALNRRGKFDRQKAVLEGDRS